MYLRGFIFLTKMSWHYQEVKHCEHRCFASPRPSTLVRVTRLPPPADVRVDPGAAARGDPEQRRRRICAEGGGRAEHQVSPDPDLDPDMSEDAHVTSLARGVAL